MKALIIREPITNNLREVFKIDMDVRELYLKNQVSGSSPEQLLILLLEGGERFIRIALNELDKENMQEVHNNIIKSQNIYLELFCALDQDAGDYVENLQGLYYLMYNNLLDANVKKDSDLLKDCLKIAVDLTGMWREVIAKSNEEKLALKDEIPPNTGIDIRG
ncbi:flagellar export chaperone FliS [bacterium]|nr:flagellar export chaperone FliS [bacterium]